MRRIQSESLVLLTVLIITGCATKYDCLKAHDELEGEVCGVQRGGIYCVKAPCPQEVRQTYSSAREACIGSTYFTKGECSVEGDQ